jgi:DNA-binding NarL/FixJ family response regulator
MEFEKIQGCFMDENVMKSKKVIIWGRDDLLNWIIEHFLTNRKDWEVMSFSNERGIDFLIQEVENINPDVVVVVYQHKCVNSLRLLTQLLYARPTLTMITINPENNATEVYTKKQLSVYEVSDLISIVESEPYLVH